MKFFWNESSWGGTFLLLDGLQRGLIYFFQLSVEESFILFIFVGLITCFVACLATVLWSLLWFHFDSLGCVKMCKLNSLLWHCCFLTKSENFSLGLNSTPRKLTYKVRTVHVLYTYLHHILVDVKLDKLSNIAI